MNIQINSKSVVKTHEVKSSKLCLSLYILFMFERFTGTDGKNC